MTNKYVLSYRFLIDTKDFMNSDEFDKLLGKGFASAGFDVETIGAKDGSAYYSVTKEPETLDQEASPSLQGEQGTQEPKNKFSLPNFLLNRKN